MFLDFDSLSVYNTDDGKQRMCVRMKTSKGKEYHTWVNIGLVKWAMEHPSDKVLATKKKKER